MAGLQIDLRYKSELHDKLKKMIQVRLDASRRKMAMRHKKWREAEELFLSYNTPSEDKKLREDRKAAGDEETFIQINIPYSYAILLTAHTYWSSVFLTRNPVMQFTGRHGESQQQVQALEALIDYQVQVGGHMPVYYLWLLDAGKYGIGIIGNYWTDEVVVSSRMEEVEQRVLGVRIPGKKKKQRVVREIPGFSGNKLFNIRPYDFFPDPSVSLANFQQGEFCGRLAFEGWNEIRRKVMSGYYIAENVDVLKTTNKSSAIDDSERGSSQMDLPERNEFLTTQDEAKSGPVQMMEMFIELIPSELGLGETNRPEKWCFVLANNEVIIGAHPLGCDHNQYPFLIQMYDIDGYSHNARGMMEVLKPLNATLDWLYNSHFFNVAKVMNDMLVVDPQRVILADLLQKGAGKIIRLSPRAYGTDVRAAVSQLPVADVTQTHLRDAAAVMDLMQRCVGATDNLMGMVNQAGRRTATEIRTSSSFGVNRLKIFSEFNSALGWNPLSQMLLMNTQQNYSLEQQYKIAGDLISGNPKFIPVRPDDIAGFYDFVPVDGTLPIDRMAQANLWKEILLGMNQMPWLAQQYDLAGIFAWMAQIAGLKNISQFKIQISPDQQLMAQVQAGNVIPMKGGPGNADTAGAATTRNSTAM